MSSEFCVGPIHGEKPKDLWIERNQICWRCSHCLAQQHTHWLGWKTIDGHDVDFGRMFGDHLVSTTGVGKYFYVLVKYPIAPIGPYHSPVHYILRLRSGRAHSWYGHCMGESTRLDMAVSRLMARVASTARYVQRREHSREQRRAYRAAQEAT